MNKSYKKRVIKYGSILFIALMLFSIVGANSINVIENEDITITILHTNDTHGRVIGDDKTIGIDKISSVKSYIKNCILVDAGDAIHGTPFSILNEGEDTIKIMKEAGYNIMAPGNHDFNYGYKRLKELSELAREGENNFEIICANTSRDNEPLLMPNMIKEVDNIKVGFFGLITMETKYKTNPNNVKGIEFYNPISISKQQVIDLKAQGADIIVAITHLGIDESSIIKSTNIAEEVEGIDLIIDGHSHTLIEDGLLADNNTLICSAGEYGENLGVIEITIDKDSKNIKEKKAHIISKEEAEVYDSNPLVKNILNDIVKEQESELSKVMGESFVDLEGERAEVRTRETNLGNLIADSMLYETRADIAIISGGGIRASIEKGDVTVGNIIRSLPFKSYIVTKKLTGTELKEVLELAISRYPERFGGFPQVGGMSFVFDINKTVGDRIIEIKVDDKDIVMDKEYIIATTDFIAEGGDDFPCFKEKETIKDYRMMDEVLGEYIQILKIINNGEEGRIKIKE